MEDMLFHLGASPKMPLDLGEPVNCHQRGRYPLSINNTAQLPLRIEGTIVFG